MAEAVETSPASSRRSSPARRSGETGNDERVLGRDLPLLHPAQDLARHPVRRELRRRGAPRSARSSRRARAADTSVSASGGERPYASTKRARRARGSSGIARRGLRDPGLVDDEQRRGRAPGSSGSRAPLPCSASATVRPAFSSQRRVSWTIFSPRASASRLPLDLVLDRLGDEPDRVQVLDLDARAEGRRLRGADRDVRVAAQVALLHVAVARRRCSAGAGAAPSGRRRPPRRVRRSGSLTISTSGTPARFQSTSETSGGHVGVRRVVERACPRPPRGGCARAGSAFSPCGRVDLDRAARRERPVVLRDLVALRQVRVEVVLARELRLAVDRRADRASPGAARASRPRGSGRAACPGKPRQTGQVAELAGAPDGDRGRRRRSWSASGAGRGPRAR